MIMSHDEEKYKKTKKTTKNNTHTQETPKLRTNVNIECDSKQQEDWRLGFKKIEKKK